MLMKKKIHENTLDQNEKNETSQRLLYKRDLIKIIVMIVKFMIIVGG